VTVADAARRAALAVHGRALAAAREQSRALELGVVRRVSPLQVELHDSAITLGVNDLALSAQVRWWESRYGLAAGDLLAVEEVEGHLWVAVAVLTLDVPPDNVKHFGAKGDGVTDDTAAIQAAAAAGGEVFFPPGTYLVSAPIALATQGARLRGVGATSILKATAGFAGASIVSIAADFCGVVDLRIVGGPSTTSSSNPATIGIALTGARYVTLRGLRLFYVNGWAIKSLGTSSVNNVGTFYTDLTVEHCAQGIWIKGVSGSNWVGQVFMSGIHLQVIDNGDGLLLEDINDIEVVNINGAVAGGSTAGSMLHIVGNSNSNFITNFDLGCITPSSVSPVVLIETGANGSPSNTSFMNGVVQSGLTGLELTGGSDTTFSRVRFKLNQTHGVHVTTNATVAFSGCIFSTNNQSLAASSYDMLFDTTSSNIWVDNCRCESVVGASGVASPVKDIGHRAYFFLTSFIGSGTTPSLVFASGGTPQIVRGCVGYNPRGNITAPTIGASPFSVSTSQNDVLIVFTNLNGGTITAFSIGGQSIGVPVVGASYRVPARQTVVVTYAVAAPTWLWIAE
jgi:hypothetical protein